MHRVESYAAGGWHRPTGEGQPLLDAATGQAVADLAPADFDLAAAVEHGRVVGGPALRRLTFHQRASILRSVGKLLLSDEAKEPLYDLSYCTGATRSDSWVDIEGGAGVLLSYASKARRELPNSTVAIDGPVEALSRDDSFSAIHVLTPRRGVEVQINAFNFPVWGMLEKFAPAFVAGVPSIVKPASPTAYLAEAAVRLIIDSGLIPEGSLQLVCTPSGEIGGLLDSLGGQDSIAFTGSAATAARLRAHPAVTERAARLNIEADSLNAAVLAPCAGPGTAEFDLFTAEVVKEMTAKAGQKCTAIRRALVPAEHLDAAADSLAAALSEVVVGDPRSGATTMGPLVGLAQRAEVAASVAALRESAEVIVGSDNLSGAGGVGGGGVGLAASGAGSSGSAGSSGAGSSGASGSSGAGAGSAGAGSSGSSGSSGAGAGSAGAGSSGSSGGGSGAVSGVGSSGAASGDVAGGFAAPGAGSSGPSGAASGDVAGGFAAPGASSAGGGAGAGSAGGGAGAFMVPMLLRANDPAAAAVHTVEAFGPVCTLVPYRSLDEAVELVALGRGSLVASLYGADRDQIAALALGVAAHHGRVLLVDESMAAASTGHGSPLPPLVHGGPGRAGGGQEMGGMRGVFAHMQRTAVQGSPDMLTAVTGEHVSGAATAEHKGHPFKLTFDDLEVGDSITTESRVVTRADIAAFAESTGDRFYAHMDDEAAARSPIFNGLVAHGYLVLSFAAGLFVWPDEGPVLANYGIDRLRFAKPTYPGDEIHVVLTCKRKTLMEGRGYGEVAWDTQVVNQHGEVNAAYDVLTMVANTPGINAAPA